MRRFPVTVLAFFLALAFAAPQAAAEELVYCGKQSVPIRMENLPSTLQPWYGLNNRHLEVWNRYVDVYRSIPSDGSWGRNSVDEFGGWPSSAELFNKWGGGWAPSWLAQCMFVIESGCGRMHEADVAFNPAFTWTNDQARAAADGSVIYYPAVLLHELGHTWGLQIGAPEYRFNKPTVMHSYHDGMLQDSLQIHAPDARLFRQNYGSPTTPVRPLTDVGVLSKYADPVTLGWKKTTTDRADYLPGERITISNLTVENTGTTAANNVRLRFYLSRDRVISSGDRLIGEFGLTNLPPGSWRVNTYRDIQIPRVTPFGTYYVGAVVTRDGYLSDDLPQNNKVYLVDKIRYWPTRIIITEPAAGGEGLYINWPCDIRWTSERTSSTLRLEVSRDGGSTWETVAAEVPNTGRYTVVLDGEPSRRGMLRLVSVNNPSINGVTRGTFPISVAASEITNLSYLFAGSRLYEGEDFQLAWTAPPSERTWLDLSRDGGATWETVADPIPGRSYSWTVAGPPTDQAALRVTSSKGDFTISAVTPPFRILGRRLVLTSPLGGEYWRIGAPAQITWRESDLNWGHLDISLSRNGGVDWETVAENLPYVESHTWTSVTGPASADCRIRIRHHSDTYPMADVSAYTFSIGNGSLTLTSPNGGEAWLPGESRDITWQSSNAGSGVKIHLSRDDGATWEALGDGPNTGVWTWDPVTPPATNRARIRVMSAEDGRLLDTSDAPFTIRPRTITVTRPNGGEFWRAGDTETLTWDFADAGPAVNVRISRDGGSNWEDIAMDIPNTGYLDWKVSGPGSANCIVLVASYDYPWVIGRSAAPFTVSDASLTVTYPNGGELWQVGKVPYDITWTSVNLAGNVTISLSLDGAATWDTIAASVPNTGTYTFEPAAAQVSGNCLVRVAAAGQPLIWDMSDKSFVISDASLTVTEPNGGETWRVGTAYDIAWESANLSGDVKVELSSDGGNNWTTLAADAPTTGSLSHTPTTGQTAVNCLVRVSANGVPGLSDSSDSFFAITDARLTLLGPTGGETLTAGVPYDITWSSHDLTGTILIELSTDGAQSWLSLHDGAPDTGLYTFTPTAGQASTACFIRLTANDLPWATDTSKAAFTIAAASLTVTAPNGGESWKVGIPSQIQWTSSGLAGNLIIKLSTDGGANWDFILHDSAPDTGSFEFTPDLNHVSTNCLVQVSSDDGSVSDQSDAVFTIE